MGSKLIPLTKGKFAIVDDEDYEQFSKNKWHVGPCGYARRSINLGKGKFICKFMHVEVLKPPIGMEAHHRNGNKLDNRRANLASATAGQNAHARRKTKKKKSSKYKGVTWLKSQKCWQARLMKNYKPVFLGNFANEIEAAKAYDQKAKELFKEFAVTNF